MATRKHLLLVLVLLACTAQAQAQLWQPYVEFEGRGTTIRGVGQTKLMVPLAQDCESLLFADVRAVWSEYGAAEGNWGVGYRKVVSSDYILGAYAFYDYRETELDNDFDQISFGAELLGWRLGRAAQRLCS